MTSLFEWASLTQKWPLQSCFHEVIDYGNPRCLGRAVVNSYIAHELRGYCILLLQSRDIESNADRRRLLESLFKFFIHREYSSDVVCGLCPVQKLLMSLPSLAP